MSHQPHYWAFLKRRALDESLSQRSPMTPFWLDFTHLGALGHAHQSLVTAVGASFGDLPPSPSSQIPVKDLK